MSAFLTACSQNSCIIIDSGDDSSPAVDMFKIETGSRTLIAAPTGTGKSSLVAKIIENYDQTIKGTFSRILWVHGSLYEPIFDQIQTRIAEKQQTGRGAITLEFSQRPLDEIFKNGCIELRDTVCIIDDLYDEATGNKLVSELFTRHSRHLNITVILVTQNPFSKQRFSTTIRRNLTYIILLYSGGGGANQQTLQMIGKTYFALDYRFFMAIAKNALQNPYDMLILNFSLNADNRCRFYTSLLPEIEPCYVYIKN